MQRASGGQQPACLVLAQPFISPRALLGLAKAVLNPALFMTADIGE
jgi:hypothetical protein